MTTNGSVDSLTWNTSSTTTNVNLKTGMFQVSFQATVLLPANRGVNVDLTIDGIAIAGSISSFTNPTASNMTVAISGLIILSLLTTTGRSISVRATPEVVVPVEFASFRNIAISRVL